MRESTQLPVPYGPQTRTLVVFSGWIFSRNCTAAVFDESLGMSAVSYTDYLWKNVILWYFVPNSQVEVNLGTKSFMNLL